MMSFMMASNVLPTLRYGLLSLCAPKDATLLGGAPGPLTELKISMPRGSVTYLSGGGHAAHRVRAARAQGASSGGQGASRLS